MNRSHRSADRQETASPPGPSTGESGSASGPIDWHEPEVLRQQLITAGLEVLDRDGPGYHVSGLTYAQVFAHLEAEHGVRVTRGSVHGRIWPNQAAFRLDAIVAYHHRLQDRHDMSLGKLEALVEEFEARETGPDGAPEFLERMALNHDSYTEGKQFPPTLVIRALSLAGNPIERATLSGMDQLRGPMGIDRMAWLFRRALNAVGHRPRQSLGLDDAAPELMSVLVSSTATGLMLDGAVGMPEVWSEPPKASENQPQFGRSLFRFALQAFFRLLFEPSPPGFRLPVGDRPHWPGRTTERPGTAIDPATLHSAKRRSRGDLKKLILAAAVEMMERNGLSLTASSIGYRPVFDRIKEKHGVVVNRSSVHRRLWNSHDEFKADVLDAAMAEIPAAGFVDGLRLAEIVIDEQGMVDTRRLTWEAVQLTVHGWWRQRQNLVAMSRSNLLKAALLDSSPDERLIELQRKLTTQQEAVLDAYRSVYVEPLRRLRLTVDPALDLTWDEAFQIQAAGVMATTVGLFFDHQSGLEPPTRDHRLTSSDAGPDRTWSTPALGALAYTNYLFRFGELPAADFDLDEADEATDAPPTTG